MICLFKKGILYPFYFFILAIKKPSKYSFGLTRMVPSILDCRVGKFGKEIGTIFALNCFNTLFNTSSFSKAKIEQVE